VNDRALDIIIDKIDITKPAVSMDKGDLIKTIQETTQWINRAISFLINGLMIVLAEAIVQHIK
jgi:hypothetical protein